MKKPKRVRFRSVQDRSLCDSSRPSLHSPISPISVCFYYPLFWAAGHAANQADHALRVPSDPGTHHAPWSANPAPLKLSTITQIDVEHLEHPFRSYDLIATCDTTAHKFTHLMCWFLDSRRMAAHSLPFVPFVGRIALGGAASHLSTCYSFFVELLSIHRLKRLGLFTKPAACSLVLDCSGSSFSSPTASSLRMLAHFEIFQDRLPQSTGGCTLG